MPPAGASVRPSAIRDSGVGRAAGQRRAACHGGPRLGEARPRGSRRQASESRLRRVEARGRQFLLDHVRAAPRMATRLPRREPGLPVGRAFRRAPAVPPTAVEAVGVAVAVRAAAVYAAAAHHLEPDASALGRRGWGRGCSVAWPSVGFVASARATSSAKCPSEPSAGPRLGSRRGSSEGATAPPSATKPNEKPASRAASATRRSAPPCGYAMEVSSRPASFSRISRPSRTARASEARSSPVIGS
jgi:hypothetical protein